MAAAAQLLAHYFTPDFAPELQAAVLHDWYADLHDLPEWAVREAMTAWRRSGHDRRPTPGAIRTAALRLTETHRALHRKLEQTLLLHLQHGPDMALARQLLDWPQVGDPPQPLIDAGLVERTWQVSDKGRAALVQYENRGDLVR